MDGQFTIIGENQTIGAAGILVLVRPGAAFGFKVLRAWAKQSGTATSNQVRVQLGKKASAFPTTLASATPQALDEKHPTSQFTGGTSGAAGTCGINATVEGAGAFTAKFNDAFNTLTGFEWTPVFEELRFRAGSADAFVMRFPATPAITTGWEWGVVIQEES